MVRNGLIATGLGGRDRLGGDAPLVLALEPGDQRSHTVRRFGSTAPKLRLDIRHYGV
jgi:hypothetical protein